MPGVTWLRPRLAAGGAAVPAWNLAGTAAVVVAVVLTGGQEALGAPEVEEAGGGSAPEVAGVVPFYGTTTTER